MRQALIVVWEASDWIRSKRLRPLLPILVNQLIKAMINFELHGLMDCDYEIAWHFRSQLQTRFDMNKATGPLLRRPPPTRNTADVIHRLRMTAQLRSGAAAGIELRQGSDSSADHDDSNAVKGMYENMPIPRTGLTAYLDACLQQIGGREFLGELRRPVTRRLRRARIGWSA